MIQLSVIDRDGGELDVETYETVEELLTEWPDSECCGDYWQVWAGSKK